MAWVTSPAAPTANVRPTALPHCEYASLPPTQIRLEVAGVFIHAPKRRNLTELAHCCAPTAFLSDSSGIYSICKKYNLKNSTQEFADPASKLCETQLLWCKCGNMALHAVCASLRTITQSAMLIVIEEEDRWLKSIFITITIKHHHKKRKS